MIVRILKSGNALVYKNKNISYKKLGHLIRAGNLIEVKDTDDYDWTKEVLIEIVFGVFLSKKNVMTQELLMALEYLFTENQLITIIENGGLSEYILRRKKGLCNEEA